MEPTFVQLEVVDLNLFLIIKSYITHGQLIQHINENNLVGYNLIVFIMVYVSSLKELIVS